MLGNNLTKIRVSRGLTQTEVAKRVNVSAPYINQIEGGTRNNLSLEVLNSLCDALDCTADELLGRKAAT